MAQLVGKDSQVLKEREAPPTAQAAWHGLMDWCQTAAGGCFHIAAPGKWKRCVQTILPRGCSFLYSWKGNELIQNRTNSLKELWQITQAPLSLSGSRRVSTLQCWQGVTPVEAERGGAELTGPSHSLDAWNRSKLKGNNVCTGHIFLTLNYDWNYSKYDANKSISQVINT